jgi:thiamine pyrophosphate-dependent acetolactate synthase large subunit-like protein
MSSEDELTNATKGSSDAFPPQQANSGLAGDPVGPYGKVAADESSAAATARAGAERECKDPSLRVSQAVTDSLAAPPQRVEFPAEGMTGAQVFANLCCDEDLAALFCAAGNYHLINEIAQVGIPCYGGRTEGSMCSAADAFSRVTGEVVACSGTEGPGFTHMIMNIGAANAAHTPLLVLASNTRLASEDNRNFIQFMYQQPVTEGMKKYGKRITVPSRIYEYGSYAFRHLKSGVPGVVHLDFPEEVALARFKHPSELACYFGRERYRSDSRPCPAPQEMRQAIDMIAKAERPVLIAGHGVFLRKAWEPLMRAAEKHEMAVVGSGPVRGHFPDDHRLSGSLSNDALLKADLAIFVGQYQMPTEGAYTLPAGIRTIRVHPVQEDIGRNWPVDLGIVSDEKHFLEALADGVPPGKRDLWVNELAAAKHQWERQQVALYGRFLQYTRDTNTLHPFVLCKEVHDFLYHGRIDPRQTLTLWGGNMIGFCASPWLRAFRPGQEVPVVYQFGPMGPEMAMAMGAGAAVQRGVGPQAPYRGAPVVVITGDAGMAFSLFELDTCAKYRIPVICLVYNNNCWGTYSFAKGYPRALHMYMFQDNLRYDKMAEHLGARGEYVRTPEELTAALQRSYEAAAKEELSTLINCQGLREFNDGSLYPPPMGFAPEPGVGGMMH